MFTLIVVWGLISLLIPCKTTCFHWLGAFLNIAVLHYIIYSYKIVLIGNGPMRVGVIVTHESHSILVIGLVDLGQCEHNKALQAEAHPTTTDV